MNHSSGKSISRRGFLTGAAGVAAVAALPSSSPARASAVMPSGARRSGARPSLAAPIAGATISAATYGLKSITQAADKFDGYVGSPLALTIQKFYVNETELAQTQLPPGMSELNGAGCKFLVDVKPSMTLTSGAQTQLSNWLGMLNTAGISYRVVLYSECNNVAFATPQDWFPYWSFYAPVIKDAGPTCGYNPGCGGFALRALQFFPSNPTPDELWMDYYATGFRSGSRVDQLIAMAQSNGIAGAGLAEWGWFAGSPGPNPITIPWWDAYCGYLMNLVSIGHVNLGGMYYGSSHDGRTNNVINSASDPRVPMIQKVSTTFAAG